MSGRPWTDREVLFLKKNWPRMSVEAISASLGRTKISVRNKARNLYLGRQYDGNGETVTIKMINTAFGKVTVSHLAADRMEKTGLKVRRFRFGRVNRYCVKTDDFWDWLRFNQDYYPVSKLEPLALGPEPDWVADARKAARMYPTLNAGKRWTEHEEMLLRSMARQERPIRDICAALKRTENAVRTHAALDWHIDLSYAADHRRRPWTDEEDRRLVELVKAGRCSMDIARQIDRSERMVRVRLKELCGTSSVGKVMAGEEGKRGKRKRDKAGSAGRVRTGKRKAG